MVAFSGPDPIGVLIGAKRASATLVHTIAVHPEHVRQGHGRHLLTSLGSKLAILGPPRIVAEVPESLAPARALFSACGYAEEAVLTDYVLRTEDLAGEAGPPGRLLIPVTVDDLAANGLFDEEQPRVCWGRSLETLTARKDDLQGVAIASDERLEAYLLYIEDGSAAEVADFRSFFGDPAVDLRALLDRARVEGTITVVFQKIYPGEIDSDTLAVLGFRPAGGHRLFAAVSTRPAP